MFSEMEGFQRKRGVQDRRLSIIDVSSADDSLLDPVSGNSHKQHSENQEHVELLDTPNSKKFEDATSKLEEWEQEPRPTETFEVGKAKKNSKCNLRKSLAWDSAFFTSAGVLDPEELSSIIEGVEKDENHALPGIKEDVHLSCESLTTLESDSMTLESLEADLFEDIRASIQKSTETSDVANGNRKMPSGMAGFQTGECKHALPGIKEDTRKSCESISTLESDSLTLESLETDLFEDIRASIQKSSNSSNVANGNSKVRSRVAGFQTGDVLKKISIASGNKMNTSPSSEYPSSTSMQLSGKMMKNPPRPQVLQKVGAMRSESSTVKQQKVPARSIPMSAKRASLGGLHFGSEKDKANRVIGGRVSSVPKAPTLGGSRGVVPKTTLSSKSSSAPSGATKTKLSTSTSLSSNSSGNNGKSPLNSVRRKVDARTVKPPPSGSAVRTPSKIASRNKTDSGNSGLSGLTYDTKLSSSISPASSVSDWSSESTSSTCVTKQRSNSSRTSIDSISSSCRKVLSDTDTPQVSSSLNSPSDSNLEGQESQLIGFVNQCTRSTTAGTVLPPAPMKPSGLRLPSPKIGFFDGMKSSVRTPRGGMQSHTVVPSGLPKHGRSVNPSEGQNKAKPGKLQSTKSIMSIKNAKPNNQPTSQPNPLHESSDVAVKTFSGSENVKSSSEIPKEVLNTMLLESTAGNISKNMTEGHIMEIHDLNLGSTHNIGFVNISMEKTSSEIKGSISSMNVRASSIDEERNRSDLSSTYDVENSSSEIVGEGSTYGESNLSKAEGPDIGMHIIHLCDTENKKVLDISMHKMSQAGNNAMHSEISIDVGYHNPSVSTTEIDCLSSKLEVMGINSETQKQFNSPSLSFSQTDLSSQDNPNGVELSSRKELDCPKQEESLNGPNTPSLYMPASTRRPFAVKDSFCNMDGLSSVSTESTVAEVKSTILPSSESLMKEN